MKKKILAFVLTTLLVCQLGVVAFAEDTDTTVAIEAANTTVNDYHSGDVTTNSESGVVVSAGSEVTDYTTKSVATEAQSGDISVTNAKGNTTDVNGVEVNGKGWYSEADSGAIVDGDITVNNKSNKSTDSNGIDVNINGGNAKTETSVFVVSSDGEKREVSVTNGDGIDVYIDQCRDSQNCDPGCTPGADATVFVYGDVDAKRGIVVNSTVSNETYTNTEYNDNVSALIVVDGTVDAQNAAVRVDGKVVPTIVVGELTSESNKLVNVTDSTIKQDVLNNLYYIISSTDHMTVNGATKLSDVSSNSSIGTLIPNYDIATAGTTITLSLESGYELVNDSDIKNVTCTQNNDGTYTVNFVTGGGLRFSARVKYVAPVAYSTTTSVTTNTMKGDKNSSTQPIMVVNMKASHFQKVMVDGTDLAESNFVTGAKENGLLTFQFSTSYIKSLAAGTYSLQFVTTENVTYTMKLVMAEDGTYTVSF